MNSRIKANRRVFLWIVIPILVLSLLLSAGLIWLESYYRADGEAIEAFAVGRKVTERTLENGDTVFDPGGAGTGLIFYPGGKVEETAYAPLLRTIAADGVLCVLCRMPFRLAVLDPHAADSVREALPGVERWYIGGHSLGGTIAARELSSHPDAYEGLVLLGSYSIDDLSGTPVRALSVYGSEDRVLDRSKYEENRGNLPADLCESEIAGGCHAYFGMYGAQAGDGTPTVTNEAQIRAAAEKIAAWIGENGGAYAQDP